MWHKREVWGLNRGLGFRREVRTIDVGVFYFVAKAVDFGFRV